MGAVLTRAAAWCSSHARGLRRASALAGLALLALMVHRAGAGQILAGLAAIGPWFLVSLGVSCTWILLNAGGWRLVLHPARPPLGILIRAYLASEAVSNVTPFLSLGGEPLKVLFLRGHVPGTVAAASVVSDNVVHAGSAVIFMLGGLLLGWQAFDLEPGLVASLLAAVACVAGLAWLLLHLSGGGVATRLAGLAARALASSRGPAPGGRLAEQAVGMDSEMQRFLRSGGWWLAASLAAHVGGRVMGAVEAWILLAALGTPVSLAAAIFIIAVAHVLVNLVFAVIPSQLGVQEATAYALFGAVGLDPSHAVALMLARRVRGFFWNAVGLALLAGGRAGLPRPATE